MMEVEVTPSCSTLVMGEVTSRTLQEPPLTGVLYNCHRSVTPPLCTATFIIMIHSLSFFRNHYNYWCYRADSLSHCPFHAGN